MQALGTPEAGNAREMNDFYENELANHADLMPGALTALEELGEVATLAIVSNGATQVQESRIAASGIGRFMDGVYISEKVGATKPSPKLLDYAIRDLGLTNRSRVLTCWPISRAVSTQGSIPAGSTLPTRKIKPASSPNIRCTAMKNCTAL